MTTEELADVYRNWDDEKLLSAFHNKGDYTKTALDAMLVVIDERKLAGGSAVLLEKDRERAIENAVLEEVRLFDEQKEYERRMIGEHIAAKALALKSRDNKGEYFREDLSSNKKSGRRNILVILSITAFMGALAGIIAPVPVEYFAVYCGLAGILMLIPALRMFQQAKVSCSLITEGNKIIFRLYQQDQLFTATVPFHYFYYWNTIEIRGKSTKITHPRLSVGITNQVGETVVIQGDLGALQDGPPAWMEYGEYGAPESAKNAQFFSGRPFKVLQLVRFKKILDGLHEIDEEKKL